MNMAKEIIDKYGAVSEEDNLTEEEKKEIEKNAEVISFLPIFTTLTVKQVINMGARDIVFDQRKEIVDKVVLKMA